VSGTNLWLERGEREALWKRLVETLETYVEGLGGRRVTPEIDPGAVRESLSGFDFARPRDPGEIFTRVVEGLERWQVHVAHPRYYGLFNPAPAAMGVAADALAAAYNPQLAAWSHSPFAVEVEQHLVRAFAARFGYPAGAEGTFASGGAEANHTALLAALTRRYPEVPRHGVRALRAQPVL